MLGGKYDLVALLVAAMLYALCVNLIPHKFHTPGKSGQILGKEKTLKSLKLQGFLLVEISGIESLKGLGAFKEGLRPFDAPSPPFMEKARGQRLCRTVCSNEKRQAQSLSFSLVEISGIEPLTS